MVVKPVRIETEHLVLRLPTLTDASHLLRFYTENRDHLKPWWPTWSPEFFTLRHQEELIARAQREFDQGDSVRLCGFDRLRPDRMVVIVNFNQIVRGVAHFAYLGYAIDREEEGRGRMMEALSAAIRYMFEEQNLHRIMANYIPHNRRSGAVLKRLGFNVEGYARDYLRIDGEWQDHILTSLTNPGWKQAPPV